MSNYSTIRPGMEGDNDCTSIGQNNLESREFNAGVYQENMLQAQPAVSSFGTHIPGMLDNDGSQDASKPMDTNNAAKPLVGFLVSVSKTENAEYWVLRQGQNTIGSNASCDIVLSESSVSGAHAVLAIHRNPNEANKLSVGIVDKGSSNGTFVNKNYIGFNPYQCSNLDKITIGNYDMLLMLFDYNEYGMTKSANFQSTEVNTVQNERQNYASSDAYPMYGVDSTRY